MTYRLLFEQSGTFKEALESFGKTAVTYDISNKFGKTDNVIDLFAEIERAYRYAKDGRSHVVFDDFEHDDIVIAFFPCTYFSTQAQLTSRQDYYKQVAGYKVDLDKAIEFSNQQHKYYTTFIKFCDILIRGGWKSIIENPAHNNYLVQHSPIRPAIIDRDRSLYGDTMVKPTAYFAINHTMPETPIMYTPSGIRRREQSVHGIKRSLISPEYARNFCKRFLGC